MKSNARNLAGWAVLVLALTGLSLAQDSTYRVSANIPFDFAVENQQLPAGRYDVTVNYQSHLVSLRNQETGRSCSVVARPDDGDRFTQAVLDFDVINGERVLADVKTASAGVSFTEPKSLVAGQRGAPVAIVAMVR